MASLKEFLKKAGKGRPISGMKGKESGWLELAIFELKGKRFLISDAGYLGLRRMVFCAGEGGQV